MGTFGEKLRKQRERRGLELDAISNSTKISTRMLRALEDEHFDQLPGGVFNKGFVRAYARQVGLDEEEAVTDYLAALRESQAQSQQILPDFRTPGGKTRPIPPPDSRHHILPSSHHPGGEGRDSGNDGRDLSASERRRNEERRNEVRRNRDRDSKKAPFFTAQHNEASSGEVGRGHDQRKDPEEARHSSPARPDPRAAGPVENHRTEDRMRNNPSVPGFITMGPAAENPGDPADDATPRVSPRMLVAALLLLLLVSLTVWIFHRRSESTSTSAASNPTSSAPPAHSPAATLSSPAAPSTKIAPISSGTKPSVARSAVAMPSQSPKAPTPASVPPAAANLASADSPVAESATRVLTAKPPSTFTLVIRADQTTWIAITADGKPVAHETLIAPAHTSVRATSDVAVRVGNAAGVSFLLNGKEFPAQGNVGEVKTYFFDATGLKAAGEIPSSGPVR
ncbi:MAG: helix-turn-helix domain-containing protein [Candidatus Sulfotelmatobacter sp.]